MTNSENKLMKLNSPFLFKSLCDHSESVNEHSSKFDYAVFYLDATKMKNLVGVFEQFAKELMFPDYFGHNGAALDECLSDLSWIKANGICIILLQSNVLLMNEPSELAWFIELLNRTCEEWAVPVEEGEMWDRPAKPFHVIFQFTDKNSVELSLTLSSLPTF